MSSNSATINQKSPVEKDEEERCEFCKEECCVADKMQQEMIEYGRELEEICSSNKQIRFKLYRQAALTLWGHLGPGVRKELPLCLQADIRVLYPSNESEYIGFHEKSQT